MDQPAKPFTSDGGDPRGWIGRLIIAVLLGEAIWGLIVSFMNHVFVPWLGDIMGPSSGLPTSFTQRPYNYPELFVSVFEFCIAGLVAAIINFFLQRSAPRRVKTVKSTSPPGPVRVISQAAPPTAPVQPQFEITPAESSDAAPVQDVRMYPVIPSILVPAASEEPPAPLAPAPEPRPAVIAPVVAATPQPVASKPAPPTPKAEPAKPKKPKNVYYNIVGEPMPSDED
jgi:large-conductance mechanosensitive channel